MVFLRSSVADRLHSLDRNLVDLGMKENLLSDLVVLSYWREKTLTERMMNKYPAKEYCGCVLTAASKPVVLQFFERVYFNIRMSLWAIQHSAVQLRTGLWQLELVEILRTSCVSAIVETSVLWYLYKTTLAVPLWEEMRVCGR